MTESWSDKEEAGKTNPGLVPVSTPAPSPEFTTTANLKIGVPFPESREPTPPRRRSRVLRWGFFLLAILILGGTLAYIFLIPGGENASPFRRANEPPPIIRPYLDMAAKGDSGAMRMLGTMYYNGLNIPQDRKEGIKWYRKAAAAGNVAAKKDLEQLGLGSEER